VGIDSNRAANFIVSAEWTGPLTLVPITDDDPATLRS
jgi:hypothetical protein